MLRGLAATLAAAVLLVLGAPAALAQEGLAVSSESTYTLDPDRKVVRGEIRVTLTNQTPDRGSTFFYWIDYSVPIPKGSRNVRATSQGAALAVRLETSSYPSESEAVVTFPSRLLYRQSRTFTLSFDIVGEPPRSTNLTRVGPGFASFTVIGPGDPGSMTVTIKAPLAYAVDTSSDAFTERTDKDWRTLTATEAVAGRWFWAMVSARDPDQIDETPLVIGDNAIFLESYPGDTAWSSFVDKAMTKGLPVLERLTGTPWPGELKRIREDSSVRLHGLGGYFDPSDDEIVIGEDLDVALLYHELTHAWANGSTFDQRWMYEGLAEMLSQRAVAATGGKADRTPTISRTAPHNQPLGQWKELFGGDSGDPDSYGYPASHRTMVELFAGADEKETAAILKAALAGDTAYDVPGGPLQQDGLTWQTFLDIIETKGGNPKAASVMATWVLTKGEAAELPERAKRRSAYAAVDTADGAWLPPLALRRSMTGWHFDAAERELRDVAPAATVARQLQQAAADAGTSVPGKVVALYEQVDRTEQLAGLTATMTAAKDAVIQVAGARREAAAQRNPLGRLGAMLLDVEGRAETATAALNRADLAGASAAGAAAVAGGEAATLTGGAAIGGVLLTLVVVWLVLRVLRGRRARRRSQQPQHAGVAQGVGLDPLQVQELGHPLVVGPQQLGIDLGSDRLTLDRLESVPREEAGLEGEAEQPRQP